MLLRQKRKPKNRNKKIKKIIGGLLLLVIVIVILGYFLVYLPFKEIQAKATKLVQSGQEVKYALSTNDLDLISSKLDTAKKDFESLKLSSKKVYWLSVIPVFGSYINDYRHGIEAGDEMLQAAIITIRSIEPYADLIGFKKGESFINKPAEDRLATAVLTLDKIVNDVDVIALHIDKARSKIDNIDPSRYPATIAGKPVRARLIILKDQFDGLASLFVDAKPLIKKLPEIMGVDREKTYIVLFMNDKELRPTGGFLTAYAIFRINQGKFRVERSEDIYTLDNSIANHPTAPKEILYFHKGVNKFYIRDSNISPDYLESIKLFEELFAKSSRKIAYDGIIAVDTYVLVDALKTLGDTDARGIRFSAQNDDRCDCPQVIYKLLDEIDRPTYYIKENRKGILGDLLYTLMKKALGFSPSQYWGKLAQDGIKNLQEKHILVYFKDIEMQQAVEKLNFSGRIKEYQGDYLHINDTNYAGAKSNLFVRHYVTSKTIIAKDGTVERELELEYKNPYPHSNCNLEAGQLCINAPLRNWLRVYVPQGSQLVSMIGSSVQNKYDSLGKTVFEGFVRVAPKGTAKVIIKYKLPIKFSSVKDYRLLVQKQPGTQLHQYKIIVNNGILAETQLTEDNEFFIK